MARFFPYFNNNGGNNYLRRLKQRLRDENDAFDLTDARFMELFRLNKETMRELINMLEPHLAGGTRGHKISKEQRILAAVRFFASGSYQRSVGQDCFINLSQSQISLAITEVATAIETHLHGFINFPGQEEYPGIKAIIMERFNVPGVIGFVDGTHIAITKPKVDVEHQYMNRKGYHSKNVQIICGPNNKIFSINAAHGGASHDAFIWRNSRINDVLHERFITGDRTSWLLGDSGYPLLPYILTPIRNPPENSPQHRFNVAHRRARSCIERCIGILKARFRCLIKERMLKYSPTKAGSIINACTILHNIMIHRNLPLPEEHEIQNYMDDHEDEDLFAQPVANEHEARIGNLAQQNRARVIQFYFN
ncbi:hypothetical protein Zmor_027299 [Zophobas morio]|uniref:Putative nuclease HARBI1 n=1 Tax=Zophobas morio TaxID=2755281 RepID=A0AA38HN21_9CUCU|nr:hypothetical protein Zmor_027299 [Zophobas morio]